MVYYMVCGTDGTPCGSAFDRFCVFMIIGVWGTGYYYGMGHRVAGIIWYGALYDMGYGVLYGMRHAWDALWLGIRPFLCFRDYRSYYGQRPTPPVKKASQRNKYEHQMSLWIVSDAADKS